MVKIVWDLTAIKQLNTAIDYIKADSPANAEKVKVAIERGTTHFSRYPNIGMLDKDRANNDGTFRAFIVGKYKISYRVLKDEIRILRIRHMKQKPKKY